QVDANVAPVIWHLGASTPLGGGSIGPKYGGLAQVEDLAGPSIGATYRFYKSHFVEIGGRLQGIIVTRSGSGEKAGAIVAPSIPFRFPFGERASLDTGLAVPMLFAEGGPGVGLEIPLNFAVDIIEPLHVGLSTGFGIENLTHGEAGHT